MPAHDGSMTDATLERVSTAYRQGYRDGFAGREKAVVSTGIERINDNIIGGTITPFAAFDYEQGYKAGQNDARPPIKLPATPEQLEASRAVRQRTNAWRKANGKPLLPEF